jgi:hypothetical protein
VRRLLLCLPLLAYGAFLLKGIRWGLPSAERNALYSLRPELCVGSRPSRWYVTGPLQTLQVDEASALGPLARMRPEGLDLNPHFFHWGTLHAYVSGALLVAAHFLGFVELTRDPLYYLQRPEQAANLYLVGRLLSVVLGMGALAVTYRLAAMQRGWVAGLTAGTILAASAVFSLYSRFYTPDLCVTFLFSLSVLLAARAARRQGRGIWIAADVAGLAASAKYNGALAVVAVVLAMAPFTYRKVSRAAGALAVGFVLGTPYSVIAPREFLAGVTWQWKHAGGTHGLVFLDTPPGWVFHLTSSLAHGLSWPLLAVVLAGAVLALKEYRSRLALVIGGAALAYYAVIGSSPLKFARYVLPLLPLLAALAGWGWASAFRRLGGAAKVATVLVVSAGVGWGGLLCAWHSRTLLEPDTRLEAGSFLHGHAAEGDTVAVFGRAYFHAPPVNVDRYRVEISPVNNDRLAALRPQWIVISDYEYSPYLRLARQYQAKARFLVTLLGGKFRADGYRYDPSRFSRDPILCGLRLTPRDAPHDLRYTYPSVVILRRHQDAEDSAVPRRRAARRDKRAGEGRSGVAQRDGSRKLGFSDFKPKGASERR